MKTQLRVAVTIAPLGELRPALEWVASIGARGVQMNAVQLNALGREHGGTLDNSARRDLRATLRRFELECSGLDAWIPPSDWLQAATVDRVVAAMQGVVLLAADLDRAPVTLSLPAAVDDATQEARRRDAIAAVASSAELHGVALANAASATNTSSARGAVIATSGATATGSSMFTASGIGVCIDPPAVLATGGSVSHAVAAAAGRVVAARLCDLLRTGLRGPVGQADGQLDLLEYRIALEMAGFTGLPVIDARQWHEPRLGIEQSMTAWRDAIPAQT